MSANNTWLMGRGMHHAVLLERLRHAVAPMPPSHRPKLIAEHAAISQAALRVADELRRNSSLRDSMDAEDMHDACRGGFRISVTGGPVPSDLVAAGRGGARSCR